MNSDEAKAAGAGSSETDDDAVVAKLLAGENADANNFLEEIANRELNLGEKAEDAVDYEDISDDDLAEDEDERRVNELDLMDSLNGHNVPDTGFEDDLDDLFGDSGSPVEERTHDDTFPMNSVESTNAPPPGMNGVLLGMEVASPDDSNLLESSFKSPDFGDAPEDTAMELSEQDRQKMEEQIRLFEQARRGNDGGIAPAPQTSKEIFDKIWPNFEPDKPLRFASLIPRKRVHFNLKQPLKAPKTLAFSNKVNLDISADQEKSFRLPAPVVTSRFGQLWDDESNGIVRIMQDIEEVNDVDVDLETRHTEIEHDYTSIGNVSWGDLQIACEDWDAVSETTLSDVDDLATPPDTEDDNRPTKRRKVGNGEAHHIPLLDNNDFLFWDDPELATARLSKKVVLDMNDPHLLLDVQQPTAQQSVARVTAPGMKKDPRGSLANPMFKRYNISNDEAYDALKESSQQKIRGTIGHSSIEHSLPALKLQYPFYKVGLSDRELRSFHRPTINFKAGERASISALRSVKRKNKRHLKPSEAFSIAEDLNVGDNSDILLAEYSEEYPTTLSNFGMGVKVLNYYRRANNEDNFRPKPAFGETSILLQQDKSPFALFGQVEPGTECLTLHNAMYRAPIFAHESKSKDFLVSRSQTGIHGSKYYIRSIDHLAVVGQEFPSVEVPGTHARKVTEASKKRLKMLAFRLYRRGQQRGARQPWVSNEMIKHHLPGTEIAQNRSRMREIMKYVKETGTWEPLAGETIPDEPTLRTWIKPEDICLIDSMHAGDKQLQDAGIKTNEIQDDDDAEGNEALELKLAPWNTTKNFLNACTGKAMLEVHGQGDPTGCGQAFSFMKISMKGGFRDIGESATDNLDARQQKENGGHSYNVQKQQVKYENAIARTWNKQKVGLSNTDDVSEPEMDVDTVHPTPGRERSEARTPSALPRMTEDESMSQFSRNSGNDMRGKKLIIRRWNRNVYDELEEQVVTVRDPEVIKLYIKRKKTQRLQNMNIEDIKPTGDPEFDRQQMLKLKQEMSRLNRNMERREGREKAKGVHRSQQGEGGNKTGATPRKCANCGEVGHIKTNKKLCPLLNGQKKQSDTFKDASAASPPTVAATPIAATPQAGSPM